MDNTGTIKKCKSCGFSGTGNFCSACGHPFTTKRMTVSGLLYDVFHLFTKFEKGFAYTLKQLIIAPGTMQLAYLAGDRAKHQKPFSMFFICATFSALMRYWILNGLFKNYNVITPSELTFFHDYMVFLYIGLVPVYTLLAWLFFYKSGFNFAEQGVMILYTVSLVFLSAPFILLVKFIWPHLDTVYVEFPLFTIYFIITFINFFKKIPRWQVILLSLLTMFIVFFINQIMEDYVISFLD